MLENRHLPLIRAALTFFAEEMAPHGTNVMQPYFDPMPDQLPTVAEIEELRAWLQNCELRFVCCDTNSARILDDRLLPSEYEAQYLVSRVGGQIAAVVCALQSD